MSTARSQSHSRETAAPDSDADPQDALHRHEQLLTSINAHLAALAQMTSKERLGSLHLSIAEAAVYLGIRPDTLQHKMQRGEVPFHRRPGYRSYFLRNELDKWLTDATTFQFGRRDRTGQKTIYDQDSHNLELRRVARFLKGAKPPGDPGPNES